jgi:hypothetical protein
MHLVGDLFEMSEAINFTDFSPPYVGYIKLGHYAIFKFAFFQS